MLQLDNHLVKERLMSNQKAEASMLEEASGL